MIVNPDGTIACIAAGGRILGVIGSTAGAPAALGYLLPPVYADGDVTLQIDTARSSPGVTTLRICGPGRAILLVGTAAVTMPLGDLTDAPGAVLTLTVEAVSGGLLGPMTGIVNVELDAEPEPEPEPAATITAPARLTVVDPWDEGDAVTYVAPIITGTPTAGPSVVWQFRPASGGDWMPGAAWGATVPVLAQATDVQLVTTITPAPGLAPVSAFSPVYRALPAAPASPPPLTAAQIVVVESVYRPGGQTVTFSPRVQFPGLTADTIQFNVTSDGDAAWHTVAVDGDAFKLVASDDPVTPPAYDAALWTAIPAARLAQLRFRYRTTAGGPWSAASAAVTVPLPVAVPPTLGAVTNAMITLAMARGGKNHQVFNAGQFGTNDTNTPHTYIIPAIAVWQGNVTPVGGVTPAQYMIAQFGRWDGFYPCAYGGIRGQRDFFFIACTALARQTPAIWNALGAAQKQRLDVAMRGQLVSFVWQMSATNPFILGGAGEVTIRGDNQWGRGFNPNFIMPGILGPMMIAQYMGGPAAANAFLTTYNHAAFVAEIAALRNAQGGAGLADLLLTFNGLGPGVTAAKLTAALKGPGGGAPLIGFNNQPALGLADVDNMFANALSTKQWVHPVTVGLQIGNGKVPNGYVAKNAQPAFGITEPANVAGAPGVGRNAVVGRLAAGAPAHPLLGQLGMAFELNSADGNFQGSGGGPRCAMKYAYETTVLCPAATVVLVAYNALSRVHAGVIAAFARQNVGMADLAFRNLWGNRDFSKGGRPWSGTGNDGNQDWNQAAADAKLYSLVHDAHDLVVTPWAA